MYLCIFAEKERTTGNTQPKTEWLEIVSGILGKATGTITDLRVDHKVVIKFNPSNSQELALLTLVTEPISYSSHLKNLLKKILEKMD